MPPQLILTMQGQPVLPPAYRYSPPFDKFHSLYLFEFWFATEEGAPCCLPNVLLLSLLFSAKSESPQQWEQWERRKR